MAKKANVTCGLEPFGISRLRIPAADIVKPNYEIGKKALEVKNEEVL